MRRLLAYLIMMFTAIGVIIFNVQSVLETTNDGMEFGRGTELVFALNKRDVDDYDTTYYQDMVNDGTEDLSEIDISEKVMDRLDLAGVRNADVRVVEGDSLTNVGYELRVTMSPLSDNELNNVRKVLSMTGSLIVGTFGDDYLMSQDNGQFFASENVAEIVYNGTTPYVALNLSSTTDFETMRDQAEEAGTNHADDTVAGETAEDQESTDDSEEDSTSDTRGTTLYLWANKMLDDTFARAYGLNDTVVMEETKSKVLAEMDVSNYNEETKQIVITSDLDGNAFTVASARALVNSLNAPDYGFNIEYLYENAVAPTFGNGSISVAYLVCGLTLLVAAILLVVFFGLSGLTGAVTMSLSTFASLWLVTALGFELSVSTIVGLFVVAALSVFISLNYFTHVRQEFRTKGDLEKSNREGYRRSFFLSLDASVVVLLVSLFGFLFATGHFQTFFGTVMIGSILTFFATNYLNKWAMYWLTKDSKRSLFPSFALFTLQSKKERTAPAVVSLEKKHYSKLSWPIFGSIALALLALSLPLTQAFGGTGFTVFNNSGTYQEGYTLSINYRSDLVAYDRLTTSERFLGYLQALGVTDEGNSFVAISEENASEYEQTHGEIQYGFVYYPETASLNTIERKDENDNSYFLTYFSVDIDRDLSNLELQDGQLFVNFLDQGIRERIVTVDNITVSLGNDAHFDSSSLQIGSYVLSPTNVYHSSVNLFLILFVLPLFAGLYLFLRYGILVGMTTVATGEVYSALAIALLSATRIPFNSYSAFGILASFLLVLFLLVPLLGRNKVLLKELHARHDADAELRTRICNECAVHSLPAVFGTSIALFLFAISFFFLNPTTIPLAGILALGVFLVLLSLLLFALPLYHFLSLHVSFRRLRAYWERRREKKGIEKAKPAKDGIVYVDEDSPHETIIPGLNDFHH